jgi:hypothetical protein
LHTGEGENWNAEWRDFFSKNPLARKEEILKKLREMMKKYGLPPLV